MASARNRILCVFESARVNSVILPGQSYVCLGTKFVVVDCWPVACWVSGIMRQVVAIAWGQLRGWSPCPNCYDEYYFKFLQQTTIGYFFWKSPRPFCTPGSVRRSSIEFETALLTSVDKPRCTQFRSLRICLVHVFCSCRCTHASIPRLLCFGDWWTSHQFDRWYQGRMR